MEILIHKGQKKKCLAAVRYSGNLNLICPPNQRFDLSSACCFSVSLLQFQLQHLFSIKIQFCIDNSTQSSKYSFNHREKKGVFLEKQAHGNTALTWKCGEAWNNEKKGLYPSTTKWPFVSTLRGDDKHLQIKPQPPWNRCAKDLFQWKRRNESWWLLPRKDKDTGPGTEPPWEDITVPSMEQQDQKKFQERNVSA